MVGIGPRVHQVVAELRGKNMIGTVTRRGMSQSQKPIIIIDDKTYSAAKVDLGGLVSGDRIEFDANSKVYNGSTIWFINSWKMIQAATKPPEEQKYPATPVPHIPSPIASPTPATHAQNALLSVTDVERPCCSNWGAELIRAGVVKEPADLGIWVQAILRSLRGQ
jgi:hypothetical protein